MKHKGPHLQSGDQLGDNSKVQVRNEKDWNAGRDNSRRKEG